VAVVLLRPAAGQQWPSGPLPAPPGADVQGDYTVGGSLAAQVAPLPKATVQPPGGAEKAKPPAPRAERPAPQPPVNIGPGNPPPELLASLAADRLANAPNMFGDSRFAQDAHLVVDYLFGNKTGDAALPLASADRVGKIAENGSALTRDRVYFLYSHFDHALEVSTQRPAIAFHRSFDLDRYTIGLEKTFLDKWWSVELRMPLFNRTGLSELDTGVLGFSDGRAGNLAVILKRMLYRSDNLAACIGMGIDTPTGYHVAGTTVGATIFNIHNDAVHLLPYAGFLYAPTDCLFFQGFLQVDVAANGDRIDSRDPVSTLTGVYREQTLLYTDLQVGYWLYRNRCAPVLTGLASVVEFHYTTTLQDTDRTFLANLFSVQVTNPANRVDMVNMTVGVHAELANHTLCRLGGVFPLSTGDNRAFAAEVQVQVERRF
jgi:hypothetical protein